jgi:hypothetical protein
MNRASREFENLLKYERKSKDPGSLVCLPVSPHFVSPKMMGETLCGYPLEDMGKFIEFVWLRIGRPF